MISHPIRGAWHQLDEDHRLAVLVALEENSIEAYRLIKTLFPNYPHVVLIWLLKELSKEWGLGRKYTS